jgi:hypothetical protein
MVWHRVGSAAGLTACAGSSPALSAILELASSRFDLPGSGLRAISNS